MASATCQGIDVTPDGEGQYRTRHDPDDDVTLPVRVVFAVAAARGIDPVELSTLYGSVDPDALSGLFEPASGPRGSDGRITFSYEDCMVTVRSDGLVTVRPDT